MGHLISRDRCLMAAADAERALAELYLRVAQTGSGASQGHGWRRLARVTRLFADLLETLGNGPAHGTRARPPKGFRPMPVRVSALREKDVHRFARAVRDANQVITNQVIATQAISANGAANGLANGAANAPQLAIEGVHRVEARTVLDPLSRALRISWSDALPAAWRTLAIRKQLLQRMGIRVADPLPVRSGRHQPTVPVRRGTEPPVTPLQGTSTAGSHSQGPPSPDTSPPGTRRYVRRAATHGWVEGITVARLNRARQCGNLRTGNGRLAFFCAQAVQGTLAQLDVGDTVAAVLRDGPLGLTAVRVRIQRADAGAAVNTRTSVAVAHRSGAEPTPVGARPG